MMRNTSCTVWRKEKCHDTARGCCVSFGSGCDPVGNGKSTYHWRKWKIVVCGGYFASLFIFEILQLVFHVTMGSLRLMTLLWCLICGAIAFLAFGGIEKR